MEDGQGRTMMAGRRGGGDSKKYVGIIQEWKLPLFTFMWTFKYDD